jgi:Tol biopolymer transport system component
MNKISLFLLCCLSVVVSATQGTITFISTRNGFSDVAVVDVQSFESQPRILTNLRTPHTAHPRINHALDRVVFMSDHEGNPALYVVDIHGDNVVQRLAKFEDHDIQIAADWAPDDSMLVIEYIVPETGHTRLALIDAEGEAKLPLMEVDGNYNDFFAR